MKYIELKKLIMQKLNLDTSKSDVLEYMFLEKATVLGTVKYSNILCCTKADYQSNSVFDDNLPRSTIIYGFNVHSDDQQVKLLDIQSKIYKYIPNCESDSEQACYPTFAQQITLIVLNTAIQDAINSSSLIKASGNIDPLTDSQLRTLKEGVLLYKVNDLDNALSELVTTLTRKIDVRLEKNAQLSTLDNKNPDNSWSKALRTDLDLVEDDPNTEYHLHSPGRCTQSCRFFKSSNLSSSNHPVNKSWSCSIL